jgi:hypothetical protein
LLSRLPTKPPKEFREAETSTAKQRARADKRTLELTPTLRDCFVTMINSKI